MSVRVLPRLLSAVVVGVVVVGAGCLSEIAAPGCRGPTCKVVDDNAVIGIMNGKGALDTSSGTPRHLYFYLERV